MTVWSSQNELACSLAKDTAMLDAIGLLISILQGEAGAERQRYGNILE